MGTIDFEQLVKTAGQITQYWFGVNQPPKQERIWR